MAGWVFTFGIRFSILVRQAGADELVFLDITATLAHYGAYTIRRMKEYLASRGVPVKLLDNEKR